MRFMSLHFKNSMWKTSMPPESGQKPYVIQAVESEMRKEKQWIQALDKNHIQMVVPVVKNSQLKTL